jgi:hypothetical protein
MFYESITLLLVRGELNLNNLGFDDKYEFLISNNA